MTADDLEVMGVEGVRARKSLDEGNAWLDKILARFLRSARQDDVALRRTLQRSKKPVTMEGAYAALLRVDGVADLSKILRDSHSNGGACFLGEAFRASGDRVLTYPLSIPLSNLAPDCPLLVNDGELGVFGRGYSGVVVNRGSTHYASLCDAVFFNLGSVSQSHSSIPFGSALFIDAQRDPYAVLFWPDNIHEAIPVSYRGRYSESISARNLEGYSDRPLRADVSAAVWKYLDVAVAIARSDPLKLLDEYGTDPGRTIMKDLQTILESGKVRV